VNWAAFGVVVAIAAFILIAGTRPERRHRRAERQAGRDALAQSIADALHDCPDDAPDGTCRRCSAGKREPHRDGCPTRRGLPDLTMCQAHPDDCPLGPAPHAFAGPDSPGLCCCRQPWEPDDLMALADAARERHAAAIGCGCVIRYLPAGGALVIPCWRHLYMRSPDFVAWLTELEDRR